MLFALGFENRWLRAQKLVYHRWMLQVFTYNYVIIIFTHIFIYIYTVYIIINYYIYNIVFPKQCGHTEGFLR